ncbi:Acid ceramidase [Acropora cervicornis]|uniref:Acid ceramidase n=1 Tax=Acropora cervicornis TaxID=6130 RepID=A0AAD9UZZ1_ACRCE|nr:Acid ceramidase [Acropora cervicornis]
MWMKLQTTLLVLQLKFSDQECVTDAYPPEERKLGWEVVNLDLPADQRYNDLAEKRTPQILNLLRFVKNFTSFILHGKLFNFVDKDLGPLADTLPAPYGDEIKGLSKATGIPLGEVVLYNIFYEIFTVCTSIVAEDKTGNIFQARNLDFGLFLGWDVQNNTWMISEILRTLIVNIDYQRQEKTVFKSVTFAGYVGVISGMKPGVLTLTLNERFNIDGGYIGILEWILGKRTAKWTSFLSRDVLEKATSYEEARDMLINEEILAPVYYIIGGTKSGQTNYDNWKPPFVIDDRRTPKASFRELYNVLSTQPVLNKLTTYTTLMHASTGTVETYIRFCKDPCFPW